MSNSQIATIDYDGKLTAVAEGETTVTIKAEDLYDDVCYAECKVTVTAASGIENVGADVIETEYFDLKGLRVNPDNLTPGVYIRRQGATTSKVVVK